MDKLYGGIEASDLYFNCIVGDKPDNIVSSATIPTTTPDETIGRVIAFFQDQIGNERHILSVGISSRFTIIPDPGELGSGIIVSARKPGWVNINLTGILQDALKIPTQINTSAASAAVAEWRWGGAQGLRNFAYLDIGVGISGASLINGHIVQGLLNPEIGHMLIPHDFKADPFAGNCPFHGDCFEGLASLPAVEKRLGIPLGKISSDDPAWKLEAHYISLAVANLVFVNSPQRIILGGVILQNPSIFVHVRQEVRTILNGYIVSKLILENIDDYIIPPSLGTKGSLLGSLLLVGDPTTDAPPPESKKKQKPKGK